MTFRLYLRTVTLKGFLRCTQTAQSLTPALRLHGECLFPNNDKETKKSKTKQVKPLVKD